MNKKLKKLFLALLSTTFFVTSVSTVSFTTLPVYAASAADFNQLQNVVPIGATLRSDTFPGFKVSFGGKNSLAITGKTSDINLKITVTDEKLAAQSAQTLRFLFGTTAIPTKLGASSETKAALKPVTQQAYSALVASLGNAGLSAIVSRLFAPNSTAAESNALFTQLFSALTTARDVQIASDTQAQAQKAASDYQEFVKSVAEAEARQREESSSSEGESSSSGKSDEPQKPAEADYNRVIMMFFDMCDLEGDYNSGTKNLLDLLRADIPSDTKVVITTGGTLTWHMNDKDVYKKYVRSLLYPGINEDALTDAQVKEIDEKAQEFFDLYSVDIGRDIKIFEVVTDADGHNKMNHVQTIGGRYMLEKTYLTDFVDYVTGNYSANKYDLIMSDHGGGIGGFGTDQIYKDDLYNNRTEERDDVSLSLKNMREALAATKYIQAGNKLDFLGFDACQMATVEVAIGFMDAADYLILSEENEQDDGWDFNTLMNSLSQKSDMDTEELGAIIVNAFVKQYEDKKGENSTLALIETSQLSKVYEALSEFSKILSRDILYHADNYMALISYIGGESDYHTKNGYFNSGLLDLCKLCDAFTDTEYGFESELTQASQNLKQAVKDSVVIARGTDPKYGNNGLSINFPIQPYSRAFARIDKEKGTPLYYCRFSGNTVVSIYEDNDVNPEYMKLYAEMALNNVIAHILADNWTSSNNNYSVDRVVDALKSEKDPYKTKKLIEAAEVDLSNPEDPVYGTIDQLYGQRVASDKIDISFPDAQGDDKGTTAEIKLEDINPQIIDGIVSVKVTIDTDPSSGNQVKLGTSGSYSKEAVESDDGSSMTWVVNAFDQQWYTLNGQISSFYVTGVDELNGTYTGYIPLALWANIADVQGADSDNRDMYISDKCDQEDLSTIRLNVIINYDTEDPAGEFKEYSFISYNVTGKGGEVTETHSLSELDGHYLEILGGTADVMVYGIDPDTVTSLGTVYAGGGESGLILDRTTVEGLSNNYFITDAYGNEYELTAGNLGYPEGEGLDNFQISVTGEYGITYEKSQELAQSVRAKAGEKAAENAEKNEAAAQVNDVRAKRSLEEEAPVATTAPETEVAVDEAEEAAPAAEEKTTSVTEQASQVAVEETEPYVEKTTPEAKEIAAELEETAAPATDETEVPVAEEIAAPATDETEVPVAEEIAAPAADETTDPVAEETAPAVDPALPVETPSAEAPAAQATEGEEPI